MIKTYKDFLQFIADGDIMGYRVCFESSTIVKDKWIGNDYLEYLGSVERHKKEKGYTTQYESFYDGKDCITDIDVLIHLPEEIEYDLPERINKMHWIVKYNR